MTRLTEHPILSFNRGDKLTFYFNGTPMTAFRGETVAAALHANRVFTLSRSVRHHRPRGFFCAIGKCASCMMEVNGIPNVKTCLCPVEEGMQVRSQEGWGIIRDRKSVSADRRRMDIPVTETEIAVVGGGPAGLSAALAASAHGARVMIFDENPVPGGQLIKQTHMFFGSKAQYAKSRGMDIGNLLIRQMNSRVTMETESSVIGFYPGFQLAVLIRGIMHLISPSKIIVATGASENMLAFPNNDLPGVYGAGAVQTLMNVHGILPGKRVLMIGAGNIGVIVAYQLLQAGVDVAAIVEASPRIGAYQVHASKIRRCGVPILTRHTIIEATGKERVEGAVIGKVDDQWQVIPGTHQKIDVDTICLAVGLRPSSELFAQAGCRMVYISELGGDVPWRNKNLETSIQGLFVAGDAAGIEEASSAMLEGRLAGLVAVEQLVGSKPEIRKEKAAVTGALAELRNGPFGEKTRVGESKINKGSGQ